MAGFPHFKQMDIKDCGPTCLRMVAKYYGKNYSLQSLREKAQISRHGVSLLGISDAAEEIGFRTMGAGISFEQMAREAPLPLIAHWKQDHFVVVYKIKKNKVFVADPAIGKISYSEAEFKKSWLSTRIEGTDTGQVLLLEPKPEFYMEEGEKPNRTSFGFLAHYIRPYRRLILQLILGVLVASIIQLIFPLLITRIKVLFFSFL